MTTRVKFHDHKPIKIANTNKSKRGKRIPIGHSGDGAESEDERTVRIGAAALPTAKGGWGQGIGVSAGGTRDDNSGEATIGEERVGGTTDTDGVVVSGFVGKGSPLGGLINRVSLKHKAALGAHRVSGRVVEDDLRAPLAVRAEGIRHRCSSPLPFSSLLLRAASASRSASSSLLLLLCCSPRCSSFAVWGFRVFLSIYRVFLALNPLFYLCLYLRLLYGPIWIQTKLKFNCYLNISNNVQY